MYYDYNIHYEPDEVLEYLRKSRSDEPHLTVDEVLETHARILSDWVEKNLSGAIPNENIYREVVSGETIENRPEMQKLLQRIESPKIKAILVVEPQRLSRGDLEDCGRLLKLLRYSGTKVITPMKTYDLENEFDRDAFERELKRGNEYLEYYKKIQARGKEAALQDGCFIANKPPYGYDKLVFKEGKRTIHTLQINEEKANVVRMIFDMHVNQGLGLAVIANKLNSMKIPSPSGRDWTYNGLRDLLANEHYIGKVRWDYNKQQRIVNNQEIVTYRARMKDYTLFDGRHEAIIDEETFYKVVSKRRVCEHKTKKNYTLKNPLSGLMWCGKCGRAIVLKPISAHNPAPRFGCGKQHICGNGSSLASFVMDEVISCLKQSIENFKAEMNVNDKEKIKRQENTIAILERRLKELEEKEISLWEKYSEEGMPKHIFERLKEKVISDKQSVMQTLSDEKKNVIKIDYEGKISTFHTALDALRDDDISAEVKNKLLRACIERITYTKEKSVRHKAKNESTNGRAWEETPIILEIRLKL